MSTQVADREMAKRTIAKTIKFGQSKLTKDFKNRVKNMAKNFFLFQFRNNNLYVVQKRLILILGPFPWF